MLTRKSISVGGVENHSLHDAESHVADVFHGDDAVVVFSTLDDRNVGAGRGVAGLVLTLFKQLGPVHLKQVDFLADVVYPAVDHGEGFFILVLTFDVNLNQQFPSLLFLGELDGVLASGVLLTTDFNGGVHIENGLIIWVLNRQELFDLGLFVLFYIAVQEKSRVIFFIVDMRLASTVSGLFISNQFLKVTN